jgi:hypothetical protein
MVGDSLGGRMTGKPEVSTSIDGFIPSHIPLIGLIDNC